MSNQPSRLAIRYGAYATEHGLAGLLGLAIMVFAARSSDLVSFGNFAFVLALASLQQPLAVFGLSTLLYGRAASRSAVSSRLIWPALLISFIIGAGLYCATLAVFAGFDRMDFGELYAFAGLRVIAAFGIPLVATYRGRSDVVGYVPIRGATMSVAILASVIAFLQNADMVVYAAIWGGESLLTALVLFAASLKRGVFTPVRRPRFRQLLIKGLPLMVQAAFVILYMRFDQIYVGLRFGEETLAVYSAAARLAEVGNLAYMVIALVVSPPIIVEWRAVKSFSRGTHSVLALMGLGSVVAAALSLIVGSAVLSLIFGDAFGAGMPILAIYILSTCFVAYGLIASRTHASIGATRISMRSGLAGGCVNLVLTIALCEAIGPEGAAVATVVSYMVAAFVLWIPFVRHQSR